ncbi:hypothetical protein [uncultured Erythrobacter sp.]|nr:hypothetical protein [uncultured Erythrobacter sp.]
MNGSSHHTARSARCSKQSQAVDALLRRQKYGPIRPMHEPSFVERLLRRW